MVFEGVVAADNTDAALEIELSETLTVGEVAYYCVYRVNSQSDDGCSGQLQVWRE